MVNMIGYLVYIVSTLFTYIFGILSKKYKWNESLPIPIQNFVVGLVVFVLAYIFCLIMKQNLNPEEILQQIIFAIGGAGTATLSYDTQKKMGE